MPATAVTRTPAGYLLNATPDAPDIRDRMYEPALIGLEREIVPKAADLRILDQKREGACTGFALAASINMQNRKRGFGDPAVSARMLYQMARLYDEWPGEDYEGSSIRGAIRGWWNNGVCSEKDWPYVQGQPGHLTVKRAKAARVNQLGAYYRLRPSITDYHTALNEAGIICASARVHNGWFTAHGGRINWERGTPMAGGHAFAIVGYNDEGFIVQNSWGPGWGDGGIALYNYEDWALHIQDAWVFRMAVPVPQAFDLSVAADTRTPQGRSAFADRNPRRDEIAGHFVHIDDGEFHAGGRYASTVTDVEETAKQLTASIKAGKYQHLLLYGHGGLNSPGASARRIRGMKTVFKENGIYPFHFMYDTGLCEELFDLIRNRGESFVERTGDFFDATDRFIENRLRRIGRRLWEEMKGGAKSAFARNGAGTATMKKLAKIPSQTNAKVHLCGHSTGAILMGHLLDAIDGQTVWKGRIATCSLLAPAATVEFYRNTFEPRLKGRRQVNLPGLTTYHLTDEQELDDTVTLFYRKSLLYLVSNAFEPEPQTPLLGMEKFIGDATHPKHDAVPSGSSPRARSRSETHGGFDNDPATMNDLLRRVLGAKPKRPFTEKDLDY